MLVKKSKYTYRLEFTNQNFEPVIFCLRSEIEIDIDTDIDDSISYGFRPIYIPPKPKCTVILKHLNLSMVGKLYQMFNSVLNNSIRGIGYGLDLRMNLEIKKGNQIVKLHNVIPEFDNYNFISQLQQPHFLDITIRTDYCELAYI